MIQGLTNLLEFYINTLNEINENYSIYPDKRYYRINRLTQVVREYLISQKEYTNPNHKAVLLDLIFDYYCLANTKSL